MLYPPGTTPAMLAPEHVEVFRRWTLQRIRNLPDVAGVPGPIALPELRSTIQLLGSDPSQGGPVLTIRPLEALFSELQEDSDITESVRQRIGQAVFAVSSPSLLGGVTRRSLVRFKPGALQTEVRFPWTAIEAMIYGEDSAARPDLRRFECRACRLAQGPSPPAAARARWPPSSAARLAAPASVSAS